MESTAAVKDAVAANRIVVACAYQGHIAPQVQAALPAGFGHVRYVAKFLDGRLVALQSGQPEKAMAQLIDRKSCDRPTCNATPRADSPSP